VVLLVDTRSLMITILIGCLARSLAFRSITVIDSVRGWSFGQRPTSPTGSETIDPYEASVEMCF
jgi:hypothetical protein